MYETRNNKSGKGRKSNVAGTLFEVIRYKPPRKMTFTNRREEDFERDGIIGKGVGML